LAVTPIAGAVAVDRGAAVFRVEASPTASAAAGSEGSDADNKRAVLLDAAIQPMQLVAAHFFFP
jgi:hypothetical protein